MPESAMGVLVVVVTGVTAILPLPQGLQGRRERELQCRPRTIGRSRILQPIKSSVIV